MTAAHPDRPARDPGDDLLTGWVLYPIIGRLLKDVYEDLSAAEDETMPAALIGRSSGHHNSRTAP